jgi:hypothetical protein
MHGRRIRGCAAKRGRLSCSYDARSDRNAIRAFCAQTVRAAWPAAGVEVRRYTTKLAVGMTSSNYGAGSRLDVPDSNEAPRVHGYTRLRAISTFDRKSEGQSRRRVHNVILLDISVRTLPKERQHWRAHEPKPRKFLRKKIREPSLTVKSDLTGRTRRIADRTSGFLEAMRNYKCMQIKILGNEARVPITPAPTLSRLSAKRYDSNPRRLD